MIPSIKLHFVFNPFLAPQLIGVMLANMALQPTVGENHLLWSSIWGCWKEL